MAEEKVENFYQLLEKERYSFELFLLQTVSFL